jgi:hypothetical protein
MNSAKVHSILAEVYRLLGSYTAAEFAEASRYSNLTRPVREVLRALSREASSDPSAPRIRIRESSPVIARARAADGFIPVQDIAKLIRHGKQFNSTQSIHQFAKESGLNVSPRPKESRERLAKRVAEEIFSTKEPRRSQIIARLSGGDNQTQGWIDAIKSPRV